MRAFSISSGVDAGGELAKRCHDDDGAPASASSRSRCLMKTTVRRRANTRPRCVPTGTRSLTPSGTARCDSNCALTHGAAVPGNV